MTEPLAYRCGFLIERSADTLPGRPRVYRVSRNGQSNIISEGFFDTINADSDAAFEEFMAAAIRPDFPHPYMVDDLMEEQEPTP